MTANEDYSSLVRGLRSLEFSGDLVPGQLLLTGDTVFPVLVTPAQHVLLAASKYGKGKIVVIGHESYLNQPEFKDFLKNAISWLAPSMGAIIGVTAELGHLGKTLSSSGHKVEKVSGLKKDLGVFCTTGYDDSQADDIVKFLREGGGVLIGAQACEWSTKHTQENVLQQFPGNKITSVAGIYFTDKYGEKGNFAVCENIPWSPIYTDVDFSVNLEHLLKDASDLDIRGNAIPSQLFLHGPLTFPVGVSNSQKCFFGAAFYGRGRVVVGTHESFLSKPELKTFILNAVSWLDRGRKGKVGVRSLSTLLQVLKNGGFSCEAPDLTSDLSVYCCSSHSDEEAEKIHRFVAEGGGLLTAGQAWSWAHSNPNVLSQFPGNKILNQFGISILAQKVEQAVYKVRRPKAVNDIYHFRRALRQLLRNLESGDTIKAPLIHWMTKLRGDVSSYFKLPASPLVSSLQQELVCLVQGSPLPTISIESPMYKNSKEAIIICLAHEASCLKFLEDYREGDADLLQQNSVKVQIDATNPGADAWRSTGLYLPPGKTALLIFPASAVGKGLQIQVGCQSDNLNELTTLFRPAEVVHRKDVSVEKVKIYSIWGGLIYINVKANSQLGQIAVTAYGAELAPTFVKGQTSLSSWQQTIRNYPAPWAELITENIILTVPSDAIRSLEDPEALMSLWDEFMAAIADLAAIPKKFPRPERIVADVQILRGNMHAGYPIMCETPSIKDLINIENIKDKGFWGPIHELGHNQQKAVWEFPPHTSEATCNLWSLYVQDIVLNKKTAEVHPDLNPKVRQSRLQKYLKNGAKLKEWIDWIALETYLQLLEAFGWKPFKHLFKEYQTLTGVSKKNEEKMNLWAEKFSQAVNRNLAPFFKTWGWPIKEETSTKLSALPAWDENPMKNYIVK